MRWTSSWVSNTGSAGHASLHVVLAVQQEEAWSDHVTPWWRMRKGYSSFQRDTCMQQQQVCQSLGFITLVCLCVFLLLWGPAATQELPGDSGLGPLGQWVSCCSKRSFINQGNTEPPGMQERAEPSPHKYRDTCVLLLQGKQHWLAVMPTLEFDQNWFSGSSIHVAACFITKHVHRCDKTNTHKCQSVIIHLFVCWHAGSELVFGNEAGFGAGAVM